MGNPQAVWCGLAHPWTVFPNVAPHSKFFGRVPSLGSSHSPVWLWFTRCLPVDSNSLVPSVFDEICGFRFSLAEHKHEFKAGIVAVAFGKPDSRLAVNHRVVKAETCFHETKRVPQAIVWRAADGQVNALIGHRSHSVYTVATSDRVQQHALGKPLECVFGRSCRDCYRTTHPIK